MNHITVQGSLEGKENIGIDCSKLIMGTGDFFKLELEHAFTILDEFVAMGGNLVDTAHGYIEAEEIIGKWLKLRNNRDKIKILSKGAHPDDGEPGNRVTPQAITKDLTESLERFNTNYIDLYALHRDDESVEVGPIIEVLNEQIKAGRILAIGASNWNHQRIQAANDYATKNGLIGFTFSSTNLSLAKCNEPKWDGCVSVDVDALEWHKKSKIPLLSWSSQAGGFFSGNFTEENPSDEEMVRVYYNPENWERYRRAEELAEKKQVTPIQIALAYVLNQPFQTAAIIGPATLEEFKSSLQGAEIKLKNQEVEWLDLSV
ncbi:aldo/keto reductase [Sporosarcina sp. Marseille-Q4063]|uniref:aldo/keto reductase n=1 Tax=Sporosarcina sp. Marseille-Q4063 TaxID=2810514 RepID=UPI001BB0A5F6|nr:aldo/keto reductase [Sporosarcina sp. Marseille-Q4063]QUW21513.1 aldo/keto reductase [Sporosarcina sp. Marseille-Q4063]